MDVTSIVVLNVVQSMEWKQIIYEHKFEMYLRV